MRLFDAEKKKPNGMSVRQVHDFITSLDILERKGDDPTKLTATDLMALLTWH